jgi:hypothetical protein
MRYVIGPSWRPDRRVVRIAKKYYHHTVSRIPSKDEVENYTLYGTIPSIYADMTIMTRGDLLP